MNIETRIREGRMSAYQVSTIVICMIAIVSDGYDILATALTMPAMTQEWAIDPLLQGYVISGSTAGMVIGSVGLAPLGDRFGRRPLSVVGQALITVGMVGAWLAPSYEVMLAARVLTGVGIGVVTAVMAVIAAEYATRRALGFTMALYSAGTGLGGFLAGLIAGQAIGAYGWKSMFLIGAVVNAVILVLCATSLPESVQYLAKGTRTDSLDRLNRLMRRMRRDPLETLPRRAEGEREESLWGTLRQLMSKRLLTMSVFLAVGYCCLMFTMYVNLGWTPQLITSATGDEALGLTFGTLAPFGGMIGGLLYGVVSLRVGNRVLTIAALGLGVVGSAMLGLTLIGNDTMLWVPLVMSVGFGAAIGGFYALIPACYDARIRSSAVGVQMGLGRLAAVFGPIVVGSIMVGGLPEGTVFLGIAGLLLVALVATAALRIATTAADPTLPEATTVPARG
ncbi:MAG: MFS transporter [Microbacterium sp.]